MSEKKTASASGVGHAYADYDGSGLVLDGRHARDVSLLAECGVEVLHGDEGFEQLYDRSKLGLRLWPNGRKEYRKSSGRAYPKAYRITVTVESEELSEDEARAYWQERAEKYPSRKRAKKPRDVATE